MEKGTKLILSIGDDTFIYVSPNKYIDSDTLVNTFIGLMQAHTYYIDTIIDSMRKYIIENKINYDESKDKN